MRKGRNLIISDKELELLELVNNLGPCTSDTVHEAMENKFEFLFVLRTLHTLVQKGVLERVIINRKQFYRTSRSYSYIKSFLNGMNPS